MTVTTSTRVTPGGKRTVEEPLQPSSKLGARAGASSRVRERRQAAALHTTGWVFYDANCGFCTATAARFRDTLQRRGFRVIPSGLWNELRLLTAEGHTRGGADAVLHLARHIWWAWPLWALAQLPGMRRVTHAGYRWIAVHRYCISGTAQHFAVVKANKGG